MIRDPHTRHSKVGAVIAALFILIFWRDSRGEEPIEKRTHWTQINPHTWVKVGRSERLTYRIEGDQRLMSVTFPCKRIPREYTIEWVRGEDYGMVRVTCDGKLGVTEEISHLRKLFTPPPEGEPPPEPAEYEIEAHDERIVV